MSLWRRLALSLALLASSVGVASAQAARLAELRKEHRCIVGLRMVAKGVATGDACLVVAAAVHELALGRGEPFGIAPSDTADIEGAFVDYAWVQALTATGTRDPANDDRYWFVEFVFRGRVRRVEAIVDVTSRKITLRKVEAEFGELRRLPWIH